MPEPADRPLSAANPDSENRIPCLDGIRAIAALMVMVFHFIGFHGAPLAIIRASVIGQTGVDLFFVLSGFLITRILLLSRSSPHYFRTFYARRTLRIFPLYYGFLVLYFFVLLPLSGSPIPTFSTQAWSWLYLQNIPDTFTWWTSSGPAHFWSLAIEEHFYLFWPLLVHALSPRHFRVALGVTLVVPVIFRVILLSQGIGVFYFTLTRLDALAFGGLLAVLLGDERWLAEHPRFFRKLALILGPALLGAYGLLAGSGYDWLQTVKGSLIPAFYFAFTGFCLTDPAARPLTTLLSLRWLRWLGTISYGLYVFHPSCYFLLTRFNSSVGLVPALAASFALTILVSFLSFRFFESPILGLKRHFSYDLSTTASGSQPK